MATVRLPDATALGPLPSAAGDRPSANFDTSAVGEAVANFGAKLANTGATLQAKWDAAEEQKAQSAYISFKLKEAQDYDGALKAVKPEEAAGFAKRYGLGYAERGRAFLDALPDKVRAAYGDKLAVDGMAIVSGATDFEHGEIVRQSNASRDVTIDEKLLPLARMAAKVNNDQEREAQLADIEKQGAALIDADPSLSPIDKEKAKALLRAKIQAGFATSLDPETQTRLDPGYRPPPAVDDNGKPIPGAKPPLLWSQRLDGLDYDAKVAVAKSGYAAYVAEKTKADAEKQKQQQALHNAWENAVLDGTWGQADLNAAVKSGQLTDADERSKLLGMITKRDADGLNLAAVTTKMRPDSGYKFNPFNPDDKKAIDLWYDKGVAGGGKDLLEPPPQAGAAPAGTQATIDPASLLAATVARTGYVPQSATEQIKAGIYSTDAGARDRAFTIMDALSRANPGAYGRAFTEDDRKRLDVYQQLAPMVPPDVLAKALDVTNPQEAKARKEMEAAGREIARKEITINGAFSDVFGAGAWRIPFLGSVPAAPTDPQTMAALNQDWENAYAEAYGFVRNKDAAKKLAGDWIKNKWGPSDTGSGDNKLMAFPPERYYPALDGNHHWMDEQLDASVKAAHPGAQAWGVIEAPQTETEATTGTSPGYYVWYTDENGGYRTAVDEVGTPLVVRFDYEAARQKALSDFKGKQALDAEARSFVKDREAPDILPSEGPQQPASTTAPTLPGKPAGENLNVPQRSKPAIGGKPQASIDGERRILAAEKIGAFDALPNWHRQKGEEEADYAEHSFDESSRLPSPEFAVDYIKKNGMILIPPSDPVAAKLLGKLPDGVKAYRYGGDHGWIMFKADEAGVPVASSNGERRVLASEKLPNLINAPIDRKTNPIGEEKVAGAAARVWAARDEGNAATTAALRKANLTWTKYQRHFRDFFKVGPETPLTPEMVADAQKREADKGLGLKGFNLFLDAILAVDSAMGKPKP